MSSGGLEWSELDENELDGTRNELDQTKQDEDGLN